MFKKIAGVRLLQVFCVLWAVFLFLDYLSNSNYYSRAFRYFEYTGLLITTFLIATGITYLFSNRKIKGSSLTINKFRGIYHYLLLLLCMMLIMLFYLSETNLIPSALSGTFGFLFKSLILEGGLVIIFLSAMSSGFFLLQKSGIQINKQIVLPLSLAVGFMILTTGLFFIGAMHLLYTPVVIPFVLLLILPGIKSLLPELKTLLFEKQKPFEIHFTGVALYVITLFLVALNICFITRPFPIGFDDLSMYMNIPKLMSGYHGLTSGGDAYNWSIMMSLGFTMYNSPAIALLLSITPGILSLLLLYKIGMHLNIGRNWSLLVCALFYSFPNTIWLSRNDAKIDFAYLFVSLCCVLILLAGKSTEQPSPKNEKPSRINSEFLLWALIGCLQGYCLGIKHLALLGIFAFMVVLFYQKTGKWGAVGMFFLIFAFILGFDLTRFAAFEKNQMYLRFLTPMILSIIAFTLALRNKKKEIFSASKIAFVFCTGIVLLFLPWGIKHVLENGSVSVDHILTGKSALPELFPNRANANNQNTNENSYRIPVNNSSDPAIGEAGINLIPDAIAGKQLAQFGERRRRRREGREQFSHEKMGAEHSTKQEEIRRYLGYENGIIRFISLPYDNVMKKNVPLWGADAGILIIIILPLLMLTFTYRQLHWNLIKIIMLLLFLAFSLVSINIAGGSLDMAKIISQLQNNGLNDAPLLKSLFLPLYVSIYKLLLSAGNALMPVYNLLTTQRLGSCFALIVLFSIPVYFLFRNRTKGISNPAKILIIITYCILQYWFILSSGIIWYGIVGFALLPVLFMLPVMQSEEACPGARFMQQFIVWCSAAWFLLILPFQLCPTKLWSESDMSKVDFKLLFEPKFAKFAIGASSEHDVYKQFYPAVEQNILSVLNRDKEARIVNVSTFLTYHIVNNDKRVYQDNQLGIFSNVYDHSGGDKDQIARDYKRLQIKYIVIELRTAMLDKTPEQTLAKKFDNMMMSFTNNPAFKLVYTNSIVERPDGDMMYNKNGQMVKAKYELLGASVLNRGSIALFEVL
ncbi:MAG TPA: DUF2723 domain-containing protein [Bacteroidia bacterium]|nr:DUF2723 domain-containing protein [Bacteroidia bacterium]